MKRVLSAVEPWNDAAKVSLSFERAVEIAARAHAGQVDKQNQTYLLHVLRVALAVDTEARIVAVLHDVLEDTSVTETDLERQGLGGDELAALRLVTKTEKDS